MRPSKLYLILIFLILTAAVQAQVLQPAKWSYAVSKPEVKVGEELELIFNVQIDPEWYLYSSDFDPDLGPMVTVFNFRKHPSYQLLGPVKPINPKKKYDDLWGGEYTYFTKTAQFRQKIKVLAKDLLVKGNYEYQVCTDKDGKCIPFDDDFQFDVRQVNVMAAAAPPAPDATEPQPQATGKAAPAGTPPGVATAEAPTDTATTASGTEAAAVADTQQTVSEPFSGKQAEITAETAPAPQTTDGLWTFMLIAFGSGLVALLTPCVFPMVPMTVTFFTSSSGSRRQAIVKALVYGFSIIAIYTVIGTIVAKLAGPDAANFLSTHWLPNIFFFLVFVIFGMSFLGMFEITLPHWLVNKADSQADKGGFYGVFFMAFTLVLVSFSCTGPIVGSILVASAGGETLKPIAGMFAFSMAFALPFTLFAIFPSWLSGLPRSGGWLNSVKVVLGFLELALAFKFLSIADQVYHWGILDRDVYLAIWIVIFSLMGLYLLGKLKFSHDSDLPYLSVPRLFLAIAVFVFVVYLIPGMFGAPLKALAGYLPPQTTHDFDLTSMIRQNQGNSAALTASTICDKPKYSEFLHLPHGLQGYFDLEQAKKCAKEQNKPIFIDFTGHGCVNCREMEANVWSDPEVLKRLQNDFVLVALYVDDKTELPQQEWYTSGYDNKEKRTLGKKYADYQITKFNVNAQPYYVLMDSEENVLNTPVAYDLNVANFVRFLDEGKQTFQEKSKP